MTNAILWNNVDDADGNNGGPFMDQAAQIHNHNSDPVITYSCIQDDDPDDRTVYPGTGNIDDDPLFVDADGPDDIVGTADDDTRLSPGSPSINTGDPDFAFQSGDRDLDGHARVLCGQVDMGAYELGIGDHNCDLSTDLIDVAAWEACMTGPDDGPCTTGCEAFDFEADQDVDLADYAVFEALFTY